MSAALLAGVCLALGLGIARTTVHVRPPSAEGPPDVSAELEAPSEEPAAVEIAADPAPAPEDVPEVAAPEIAAAAPEVTGAEVAAAEVAAPEAAPAVAPAPRGPVASTLVRGRVAYLRCEGGASGGACARDRAIEDAIWSAIETLPACAAAPPAPGQADLVVELSTDGREVRARDTFAADVVRLDGASVVGCLSPAITADPAIVGSTRRVVLSFRFSLASL